MKTTAPDRVLVSDRAVGDRVRVAQRHEFERVRAHAAALRAEADGATDSDLVRRLRRASIIASFTARQLKHELDR